MSDPRFDDLPEKLKELVWIVPKGRGALARNRCQASCRRILANSGGIIRE